MNTQQPGSDSPLRKQCPHQCATHIRGNSCTAYEHKLQSWDGCAHMARVPTHMGARGSPCKAWDEATHYLASHDQNSPLRSEVSQMRRLTARAAALSLCAASRLHPRRRSHSNLTARAAGPRGSRRGSGCGHRNLLLESCARRSGDGLLHLSDLGQEWDRDAPPLGAAFHSPVSETHRRPPVFYALWPMSCALCLISYGRCMYVRVHVCMCVYVCTYVCM